ncbi:hypothetical protein NA57DRAFT_74901 [Rhizodiscina lignyota]|uniref:Uncharacterized protein n=1 Tax=Rhizodiscina lignyota TaxID=1504668 RepID=A0A9P4M6Y1_9PEZI|nr:hypothetical protein NA57DRAFT_74901 [Rhizodiscina lignyota]
MYRCHGGFVYVRGVGVMDPKDTTRWIDEQTIEGLPQRIPGGERIPSGERMPNGEGLTQWRLAEGSTHDGVPAEFPEPPLEAVQQIRAAIERGDIRGEIDFTDRIFQMRREEESYNHRLTELSAHLDSPGEGVEAVHRRLVNQMIARAVNRRDPEAHMSESGPGVDEYGFGASPGGSSRGIGGWGGGALARGGGATFGGISREMPDNGFSLSQEQWSGRPRPGPRNAVRLIQPPTFHIPPGSGESRGTGGPSSFHGPPPSLVRPRAFELLRFGDHPGDQDDDSHPTEESLFCTMAFSDHISNRIKYPWFHNGEKGTISSGVL